MMKKPSLDQVIAMALAPVACVFLSLLYLPVVVAQGRPFFYASERMRSPERAFRLYKIRTMHPPASLQDEGLLGGHLVRRVTAIGAILRRTRLDELPQIFNVLKGDVRFIGPRPPLRRYVETFPEVYEEVLRDTLPGITGLATVMLHDREERLLSECRSARETDLVYRRRCIALKARLDMIYRNRRSPGLDLLILYRTFSRLSLRAHHRTWGARGARSRIFAPAASVEDREAA